MKRIIAIAFVAASLITGLSSASAQTRVKADIPFDFRVGSTLLPAGSYYINATEPGVVWISNKDGKEHAVTIVLASSGSEDLGSKLVFNRYGNQYFLRETLKADGKECMLFPQSKQEKRVRMEEANLAHAGQTQVAMK